MSLHSSSPANPEQMFSAKKQSPLIDKLEKMFAPEIFTLLSRHFLHLPEFGDLELCSDDAYFRVAVVVGLALLHHQRNPTMQFFRTHYVTVQLPEQTEVCTAFHVPLGQDDDKRTYTLDVFIHPLTNQEGVWTLKCAARINVDRWWDDPFAIYTRSIKYPFDYDDLENECRNYLAFINNFLTEAHCIFTTHVHSVPQISIERNQRHPKSPHTIRPWHVMYYGSNEYSCLTPEQQSAVGKIEQMFTNLEWKENSVALADGK